MKKKLIGILKITPFLTLMFLIFSCGNDSNTCSWEHGIVALTAIAIFLTFFYLFLAGISEL